MSLEVKGGVELRDDVTRMADLLRASGSPSTISPSVSRQAVFSVPSLAVCTCCGKRESKK